MEHLVEEKDLGKFAEEFFKTISPSLGHATVIGLSGELGSGKTTFVKAVARMLGIDESVLSPTFVIAKFYTLSPRAFWRTLVHVDAYRLEGPDELRSLKWSDLMKDERNLILIEWPEQAGEFFPSDATLLSFRFVDETTRAIKTSL